MLLIVLMLALPPPVVSQSPQVPEAEQTPGDSAAPDPEGAASSEPLLLNFRNVEIRQIIESVGELTGTNFLVDPRVRGKVTILANEPVPQSALYDVMLSILRMHGFRAVKIEGENLTRILPGNVAARFKPEFLDGDPVGESERLVTTIIRIRHLGAAGIIPMIKPLMTPEAQVLVHKQTNHLLITEVNSSLERVRRIIDRIDVAELDDFEIINLVYADAKDVVGLVQRASNKNLRHLVQVIADNKGNRVILTGPLHVRRSLRTLIAELDTETSVEATGRIRVINLHYARAEDVEKVVKGLLSSAEFIKTLGGEAEDDGVSAPAEKKPDAETDEKKDDEKDAPKKEEKPAARKKTSTRRNYVIQVDQALNALIVGGPPKVIAAVERVVREIDVPRPQVLIEAIFADVTETKAFNLGARLQAGAEPSGDGIASDAENPDDFIGAVFETFGSGNNAALNFVAGVGISPHDSPITLLVSALRSDGDSRVLSTPSILTLNNEEAEIDVSEVLSIQTGAVTDSGGSNIAYERQEFGTKLKVKPQITKGDSVRLDIEYKTEEVLPTSRGSGSDPDSRNREIKTTVLVNDGDVLVLGGLSNESAAENEERVPLLSEVPVVGHLFRNRSSARNKTTLMVFIRPTILRNADDGGEKSRERYAELRLEQLMDAQSERSLLSEEDPMVLPGLPMKAEEARPAKRKKKIKRKKRRRGNDSG